MVCDRTIKDTRNGYFSVMIESGNVGAICEERSTANEYPTAYYEMPPDYQLIKSVVLLLILPLQSWVTLLPSIGGTRVFTDN